MENIDLMVKEILMGLDSMSVTLAAEMANSYNRNGIKMGLAIHKAAKYYNVPKREVALEVNKLKRHFERLNEVVTKCHGMNREQTYWWDNS